MNKEDTGAEAPDAPPDITHTWHTIVNNTGLQEEKRSCYSQVLKQP
jgi:hypothetical protein